MKQLLWVLQGLPGSGKSYLAAFLQDNLPNIVAYSTDEFRYQNGIYRFQPDREAEFHRRNLERSCNALSLGWSVIVDNTNIRRWHCRGYVHFAHTRGIPVVFTRVMGSFPNVHGVSPERLEEMRQGMEDLTLENVLASTAPGETTKQE